MHNEIKAEEKNKGIKTVIAAVVIIFIGTTAAIILIYCMMSKALKYVGQYQLTGYNVNVIKDLCGIDAEVKSYGSVLMDVIEQDDEWIKIKFTYMPDEGNPTVLGPYKANKINESYYVIDDLSNDLLNLINPEFRYADIPATICIDGKFATVVIEATYQKDNGNIKYGAGAKLATFDFVRME